MIETMADNRILESFNNLIPYLHYFFEDDIAIGVNDTEKCLRFESHENIPTSVEEGDLIRPGSATYECTKKGQPVSMIVPREVLGTPVKSIAVPVKDENGKVVGSFSIARSLKRQEEIFSISQNLSLSLEQMSAAINEVSAGIQEVADSNVRVTANVEEADTLAKDTDEILKFIKSIAEQTNLLGLNAAIEAARAGEEGRGFSIVAKEIRKLSSSSTESIKDIKGVLQEIGNSVSSILQSINEANEIFKEQVAAVQEITSSIEELSLTAKQLENMAARF